MYCKEIRYGLRAYHKYCHNISYPAQFLNNHKAKIFTRMVSTSKVNLVQNRNILKCVEAVNEAESVRSVIRDYLAHR